MLAFNTLKKLLAFQLRTITTAKKFHFIRLEFIILWRSIKRHIVIFLYSLESGRTSAVKSQDNDRLEKVAENITALDKRMVIKFCADIERKVHKKLRPRLGI